jgi:cyclase
MLKKRIVPVQLLLGERLVKTVRFDTHRDVGDPVASSKVYSSQDADELVFLNIDREGRSADRLLRLLERVSEVCFMPLAMGGGIRTLADVEALIRRGADKVVINTAAYRDRDLLTRAADKFGAQAVIVSIDVRRDPETGVPRLFSDCGRRAEAVTLEEHIRAVIDGGAGELFVNSIERDGTMEGYDVALIAQVRSQSRVPVIACGGAGNYTHLKDAFLATDVEALACGSLFNFGDNNPLRAKAFLGNYGLPFKKI